MKIKGTTILTEKGGLKSGVRASILKNVDLSLLATAEKVNDRCYSIPVEDEKGNVAYINVDLTISTVHPSNRATSKKKSKEKETFTFEG